MLIDTHAHLDMFDDVGAVLKRASDVGVGKIINIGHSKSHAEAALKNSELWENVYATFSVHPCYLEDYDEDFLKKFAEIARSGDSKIVALGEIGLDYYHMKSEKDFQKKCFRRMLELAKDLALPVIIHCRDKEGEIGAYEDLLGILLEVGNENVVMHCYSGNLEFAKKWWSHGFLTSFTGVITYDSYDLRILEEVPRDMFMVETDAPFLLPKSMKGIDKKCEPKHVLQVAEKIAEVWGVSVEEVAKLSTENAESFFNL